MAAASRGCFSQLCLRGGLSLPQLGLGTWEPRWPGECRQAVLEALEIGYRLLDLNVPREEEAASAVLASGIPRREVFLLTKLRPQDHADDPGKILGACQASLRRLQTDYLDLYLIQTPRGGHLCSTWRAVLRLRELGLVRAVGVANFGIQHLRGLAEAGLELPEVNQVELHVWWQQRELATFCLQHGVVLMAYSPLGRGRSFGCTPLSRISKTCGWSEAQLCLRWCLQQGYFCVPKSANRRHLGENWAAVTEGSGNFDCAGGSSCA